MDRNQSKELLPFIKAFSEGRIIEQRCAESWIEVGDNCDFHFSANSYRIKPESKYRPFANAEECLNEMQKHQPFGVVKDKYFTNYPIHRAFTCLYTDCCDFGGYEDETFESCFKNLLFADGTPFGIKEKE